MGDIRGKCESGWCSPAPPDSALRAARESRPTPRLTAGQDGNLEENIRAYIRLLQKHAGLGPVSADHSASAEADAVYPVCEDEVAELDRRRKLILKVFGNAGLFGDGFGDG